MNRSQGSFTSIGGASVIVIFVVLCLSIFGTLAVTSAYADLRLTEKAAQTITNYYDADAKAALKLFEINTIIGNFKNNNQTELQLSEDINVEELDNKFEISFMVPMNEAQAIKVIMEVSKDYEQYGYELKSYKTIRIIEDSYDQTLELWDGNAADFQ